MDEVKFHYFKSQSHEEIKVDGAIGGPLPTGGGISMSVYTERHAIPTVVVQAIREDGRLGDEIESEREGKDGVVRSVQATLHMDLLQAKAMHKWLGRQINEIESNIPEKKKED